MPPFAETADVTVNTSPASGSLSFANTLIFANNVSSAVVAVSGAVIGASLFTAVTVTVNVPVVLKPVESVTV